MNYRACVFDDDKAVREIIVEMLKRRGYEVRDYPAVATCPLYLHNECGCPMDLACVDIIISDVHMPGMSGLEFVENQKRNGCKVQHIALISGAWTEENRHLARELGCDTFTKPFKLEELNRWLNKCERKIIRAKSASHRRADLSPSCLSRDYKLFVSD